MKMKTIANAISNGNNEALQNQNIFKTAEVEAHLKTLKVSKVSSEIKQVLATIGRDVHSLNRIELSQFQYLLALGTKIVKLMTVFDSKNSKQWGEIKKTFGFGKQSLSETQYKLALKVVKWESQIKSYFSPFGVNPFEMTNTGIRNKTKLKTFSNKYGLKMQCSPNGVVSQIEAYEKTNNPINFERVTGNKVKTAQPTKKVEVKKPTKKQLGTIAKTLKPLPTPVIENYKKTVITKDMVGLTIEELLAKVA
tara:strand:- start:2493 stop:3245 length:753 start_codon:yes stop_codon:yes gene_type:complete